MTALTHALGRRALYLVLLATAAAVVLPWAKAEEAAPPEAKVDGGAMDLPIGQACGVVVEHKNGTIEVGGRLVRADDCWLVLQYAIEAESEAAASPIANKAPYVSRLFKNVGVGRTSEEYWIPRERVIYLRATQTHFAPAAAELHAHEPPIETEE